MRTSEQEAAVFSVNKRSRESFDYGWKFFKGDVANAEKYNFHDSSWQDIKIPHDWSIEGPFLESNPSGPRGGYAPCGTGWYRKVFRLPEEYSGRNAIIEFDGIHMNSDVWINEKYLGRHPYGYSSFYYDLAPYLNYGSINVLAVRVDNSEQPLSRWYTGCGIYRHVWLTITDKLCVAQWGTFVTTPEITGNKAKVRIETLVENNLEEEKTCKLISRIVDMKNNTVCTVETSHEIKAGSKFTFVQETIIKDPVLWSVETPYLYKVITIVNDMNTPVDNYETTMGVRKIEFDSDRGFLLNGKNVKIKGVCLHHDGGCLGSACPDRAMERQLEILIEMGCNAIRTSHNPPSPVFLDYCDRYGILIMDEVFDEWNEEKKPAIFDDGKKVGVQAINGYHRYFNEWFEKDLTYMIHRDRNHPSVIMWSVGNEIPETGRPESLETAKKLVEVVHREDPTRPVTEAFNNISGANSTGVADIMDVVGYNYKEGLYLEDHARYPGRKIIGSETSSAAPLTLQGEYASFIEAAGEFDKNPMDGPYITMLRGESIDINEVGRIRKAGYSWKITEENDFVEGLFIWTGFDYIGEPTPFSWPSKSSYFGVIDLCGFPKDSYYFYQSKWAKKPMIHLLPHWNWSGREGKTIPVWCFSNCDNVELFLNGRSLGAKSYESGFDFYLSWNASYEPGILKAIGSKDGLIVCTEEIHTAGEPAKILLSPDRSAIKADGRDISYITVKILDMDGNPVPDAANTISLSIQGEGKLIGVDNGDPGFHGNFKSNSISSLNGLCLSVVQSTNNPGRIRISASSAGLTADSVEIDTNK